MNGGGQCEMINTSSIIIRARWPAYAVARPRKCPWGGEKRLFCILGILMVCQSSMTVGLEGIYNDGKSMNHEPH